MSVMTKTMFVDARDITRQPKSILAQHIHTHTKPGTKLKDERRNLYE